MTFDPQTVTALRRALLRHFDDAARPLPWRHTRDPYAILVSEVMSQQTRLATVVPYYERWLARFPDVHALAAADVDEVLEQWAGLGYYSRARNLHAAARIVRERHGGAIPLTYEGLRELPGVGDYTAGAIASIAGRQPLPAVDGNVRRVLARVLDLPDPAPRELRRIAAALVPADRPGDFNQSLMELGATICTPRAPACNRCPIATHCAALRNGTQTQRPVRRTKPTVPTFLIATAVVVDDRDRLLLIRRSAALLRGLWSFPGEEVTHFDAAASTAAFIARKFACDDPRPRALGTIDHAFSHRRERYIPFMFRTQHAYTAADASWIGDDVEGRALPRAQQRIRASARDALKGASGG